LKGGRQRSSIADEKKGGGKWVEGKANERMSSKRKAKTRRSNMVEEETEKWLGRGETWSAGAAKVFAVGRGENIN